MKGYFAIGVQGLSKAQNAGTLFRTAHAFGANFVFTIGESYDRKKLNQSDTSNTLRNLPYYRFDGARDFRLPEGCALVGVELVEDAVALSSRCRNRSSARRCGPRSSAGANASPRRRMLAARIRPGSGCICYRLIFGLGVPIC